MGHLMLAGEVFLWTLSALFAVKVIKETRSKY